MDSENINSEKDVQNFIAENPWLLDVNYETVPELAKLGTEFVIKNTRIDLICRHRINGRPVIIEFKKGSFYRENIGQILEYRSKVIMELKYNETILEKVFGDFLVAPVLCLVVKDCSDHSKIACNLNGIEVYEYKNISKTISNPKEIAFLRDISLRYTKEYSLSNDRVRYVENAYTIIKQILIQSDLLEEASWREYKCPEGEFRWAYGHYFLNKWVFCNRKISIGLFEDVFQEDVEKLVVTFYSSDYSSMKDFIEKWNVHSPNYEIDQIPESSKDNDEFDSGFSINKRNFNDEFKSELSRVFVQYNALYTKNFI